MDPDMLPNIREEIYMVRNHMSPYREFQDLTPECNNGRKRVKPTLFTPLAPIQAIQ